MSPREVVLPPPRRIFVSISDRAARVFICYLDESGVPERTGNTDHFVLFGLAIPALTWKLKDAEIYAIKERHDLAAAEVHTAFMLREYPEQRHITDFASLDRVERRKRVLAVRELNLSRKSGKARVQTERMKAPLGARTPMATVSRRPSRSRPPRSRPSSRRRAAPRTWESAELRRR